MTNSKSPPPELRRGSAILFDRVGGRVGPSEERDDSLPAHFKMLIFDEEASDHQRVHAGAEKCPYRVGRRVHDGFAAQVERRVHDDGHARRFPNSSISRQLEAD